MSRTIHGSSFKTLAYFRKKSAALEVYWVYVARANNESVAWPSARQLGVDTGWNKDTCLRARKWLVEHGALERVEKYVQPKWRKLESTTIQNLINLDRAEYYRPTGSIAIEGETHALLYTPVGNEGEDVSKNKADVRPRRTTTPPDIQPRRIELDSTKIFDSSKTSGKKPVERKKTDHQLMFEALCNAFGHDWTALTTTKKRNFGRVAKELRGAGATPENVPGFYAWCKRQRWPDFTENVMATRWNDYKKTLKAKAQAPAPTAAEQGMQAAMREALAMQAAPND